MSLGIDGTVRMWELPPLDRYDVHSDWVLGLDTSADSSFIVTAGMDGLSAVLDATDMS